MQSIVARMLEAGHELNALALWVLLPISTLTLLIVLATLIALMAGRERSRRAQQILETLLDALLALLRASRR
ncbi:Flp pilus assembly protein TadB [Nocardia transvalensis]|uniref:Flp pilus assembly protein TadB n=1 Tax=Nocardia transvalensis TaxID=37333 RepID=A0A7W9UI61_9NOCA|nr:hypothetical protein [Nocardia transvalensis]MBB5913921.1 Flp pilus assembly protein TadB [Nocardia transvalensis]